MGDDARNGAARPRRPPGRRDAVAPRGPLATGPVDACRTTRAARVRVLSGASPDPVHGAVPLAGRRRRARPGIPGPRGSAACPPNALGPWRGGTSGTAPGRARVAWRRLAEVVDDHGRRGPCRPRLRRPGDRPPGRRRGRRAAGRADPSDRPALPRRAAGRHHGHPRSPRRRPLPARPTDRDRPPRDPSPPARHGAHRHGRPLARRFDRGERDARGQACRRRRQLRRRILPRRRRTRSRASAHDHDRGRGRQPGRVLRSPAQRWAAGHARGRAARLVQRPLLPGLPDRRSRLPRRAGHHLARGGPRRPTRLHAGVPGASPARSPGEQPAEPPDGAPLPRRHRALRSRRPRDGDAVNAVRPCCSPDLPARTLVVLLAVTIGVGVPAGGARAALPRLEPCSTVPDAVCGHVLVPLDRSRPDGDRVAIGFAVYRHADESRPAEGTIFVTNGGPGGSATQAGRDYALSIYGALLDRRDLVLIDYRGEGLSAPIDCPWLQRGAIDLYAAFAACGERLGPRADLYGSADVAEDVGAVRAALGVDRFDYHGGSYAGADVQAYAVRHPGRLRSVVLDSPVAATGFDPWWTSRVTASARVVTRLCRRSRTCRRDHPHAAADLAWLARRLHRQPVDGTAADALGEAHDLHVDEAALAELAQLDTGGFSAQTELAAAAGSLRRGDALPLLRLAAEGD